MKGLGSAWNAGEKVTIDESMIRYNGRTVDFVQYTPRKPIKHGIKVFAICCSITAVLLGFEIYTRKENGGSAAAITIIERLIHKSGLTKARGRILYTNNWYTSINLAMLHFEKYGWRFCGTIVPTKRFWRKEYNVQATTWKDRKQVMFLHTVNIGSSRGLHTVRRSKRGRSGRDVFCAPLAQLDYAENDAAVDRNDRDSADYSTSMRTNHFYFRIFFWLLDCAIHMMFVIC
jgi:hypothetical protein